MAATTAAAATHLLVASIGNPAPHQTTLHSAGHALLDALGARLGCAPARRSRAHADGLLTHSRDATLTLWRSPTPMNASGPGLRAAWRAYTAGLAGHDDDDAAAAAVPALLVLHDEIDLALGAWRLRDGALSPRGHNGLKSIRAAMPDVRYARLAIGIGRPPGGARSASAVAAHVLRRMTPREHQAVVGCAAALEEQCRGLLRHATHGGR
jgi:PTH1 family peptidyl-tRNA hydrolase